MNKQKLQQLLAQLEPNPDPDPGKEQYMTPPEVAADLLWIAAMNDDLDGTVLDLGCGNGILGLGAAVLGAAVTGVDVDGDAVGTAQENLDRVETKLEGSLPVQFVIGDVATIGLTADTVVMNPPFGIQREDANLVFVRKAVHAAPVTYALLHRSRESREQTRAFLAEVAAEQEAETTVLQSYRFELPAVFEFHEKERHPVAVDLYKFER